MTSTRRTPPDPCQQPPHTVVTSYEPARYAFRFPNSFVNTIWDGRIPPVIGRPTKIVTRGRCGGMAFASLDFYQLGVPVPAQFSATVPPPDGHPLADYIYARQKHSMLTTLRGLYDGIRYMRWSGASAQTVGAKTRREEQGVTESIDRGQPVVLGLIEATSWKLKAQGVNHQVVCYGYRWLAEGIEFLVYDPNEPFNDTTIQPQELVLRSSPAFERAGFPYEVVRPRGTDRWRGFFVVGYQPRTPPRELSKAQ